MSKKTFWRIVTILAVILISALVLFFACSFILNTPVVRSNNIDDYVSGRFLSFPGGGVIENLIPLYEELGNYESIMFSYVGGDRAFSRGRIISLGLRVEYGEEEYLERKNQVGATSPINWNIADIDEHGLINENSFRQVVYGMIFNDREKTITYIIFVGVEGEDMLEGAVWELLRRGNLP